MTVYRGIRQKGQGGPLTVTKDCTILSPSPSQKIWNHSPDGFQWGYGGSGPAQLALALLYDVTGNTELAVKYHQAFKWAYVALWEDKWEVTTEEIEAWIAAQN